MRLEDEPQALRKNVSNFLQISANEAFLIRHFRPEILQTMVSNNMPYRMSYSRGHE